MQQEYTCTTKQGKWKFYADSDLKDAVRLALYYCWRDGEEFFTRGKALQSSDDVKVRNRPMVAFELVEKEIQNRTILLCVVDKNNSIQTL